MKEFKVRYGETVYEHRGGSKVLPMSFRKGLVAAKGTKVPWATGATSIVDPADPNSSFHYLVEGMNGGRWPDEIISITDSAPSNSVTN